MTRTHLLWRPALLGLAVLLMLAAPVVGLLPGPGGTLVFAAGLVLALRNSLWVRRRYARLTRRFPKAGGLADRMLRRASARRRRAVGRLR